MWSLVKRYVKYNNPFYILLFYHREFIYTILVTFADKVCSIFVAIIFVTFADTLSVTFMISLKTIPELSAILF